MSANKLLNRIVIPESVNYDRDDTTAIAEDLFDYTYGITSDPLTQFAVVFSALVHDVDHTGVSNGQLAKENPELASLYRNKSIAEQNSVDLAWDLFLDPMYRDLQECIASDASERMRFRQLVVNSVMATDIFDPDMKQLRNKRWDKAFHNDATASQRKLACLSPDKDRNMKATIGTSILNFLRCLELQIILPSHRTISFLFFFFAVIEHIIQASDVAHTMQHVSILGFDSLYCWHPGPLFISHSDTCRCCFVVADFVSGTFTPSGMKDSLKKCTRHMSVADRKTTLLIFGTKENSGKNQ
jgi:3'5'-cyclic nucleotide phosphodiesterase